MVQTDQPLDEAVLIVITTPSHDVFYIQQKDDSHPISSLRLKYALFGGMREEGETPHEGLIRELHEELMPEAASLVAENIEVCFHEVLLRTYRLPKKEYVRIYIYESIVSPEAMKIISSLPIKEGKCGLLVSKEEFKPFLFPEHLRQLVERYLQEL